TTMYSFLFFFLLISLSPLSSLFPYTTLFRSCFLFFHSFNITSLHKLFDRFSHYRYRFLPCRKAVHFHLINFLIFLLHVSPSCSCTTPHRHFVIFDALYCQRES